MTPAYIMSGRTKEVWASLNGIFSDILTTFVTTLQTNIPCEVDQVWTNQYDFDNAGNNTYVNKVFLRTQYANNTSPLTVQLSDTTTISGQISTKTVSTTQPVNPSPFPQGLVSWLQFNLEQNGESHLMKWFIAANTANIIMTMIIIQGEARGPVYE